MNSALSIQYIMSEHKSGSGQVPIISALVTPLALRPVLSKLKLKLLIQTPRIKQQETNHTDNK